MESRTGCSTHVALLSLLLFLLLLGLPAAARAQAYGEPDRGEPGDVAIQAWLAREAERLSTRFLEGVGTVEEWEALAPRYREEYLYMLGLSPRPERTPLRATVTGAIDRGEVRIEKLHYQSRPGLYVTANLYRPSRIEAGVRCPAVLYVCGHSPRGRDGNKTAFQSHGLWFARHGYVCLVVDTLQLGEIAALHHGTYREERWWWHSRGYTPAGVECWNGVRGIDYLVSRSDVDPERIAVTGISGGGAATFWIAAADERVRAAAPVSGMADLPSYVGNRVINGHCDCMFLYNAHRWPWTRIAALIAPRPLLFVNSHRDPIFPMDANDRIIARLERLYSLHGAGDRVDAVVSRGGHAYRQDIRQAVYRFVRSHLEGRATEVTDSEVDLVSREGRSWTHPIPPASLRVFPEDADIPADQRNTRIDEEFVPMAEVDVPTPGAYEIWRERIASRLAAVVFPGFRDKPTATTTGAGSSGDHISVSTEPGIDVSLVTLRRGADPVRRVVLLVRTEVDGDGDAAPAWIVSRLRDDDRLLAVSPRGTGETRWTRRNPPNYVERSLVLLGTTADAERIWDIRAVARLLAGREPADAPAASGGAAAGPSVWLAGRGADGVLAAYAAALEPLVAGVIAADVPRSHMEPGAPVLLNVLRVCDIPDVLGLLAPRKLRLIDGRSDAFAKTRAIFEAAGASGSLSILRSPE